MKYLYIILPIAYVLFAGYLVFSEFRGLKNKTPKNDVLVDIVIALVLMLISIYQIYKLKCNLTQYLTYLYLLVLILGYAYAVIAQIHANAVKSNKNKQRNLPNDASSIENKEIENIDNNKNNNNQSIEN